MVLGCAGLAGELRGPCAPRLQRLRLGAFCRLARVRRSTGVTGPNHRFEGGGQLHGQLKVAPRQKNTTLAHAMVLKHTVLRSRRFARARPRAGPRGASNLGISSSVPGIGAYRYVSTEIASGTRKLSAKIPIDTGQH
eukprot:COSAG02_NODE_341_length_24173_cov_28.504777_10_plen_137_part_00